MVKSIGKFMGVGNNSTSAYGSEKDILKYLNEYDTSQADNAYKNMASLGNQLSSQLSERPDYIYSVTVSDDEAKRIENATYQNAVSKIAPQFESQQRQLETRLQNQGISPGSEAYNSAMNNLMAQQNNAYVQAAFDSISAGQNAYSNNLSNQIAAGNFQNSARMLPISEISSLLQNTQSGYDVAMDKYSIANKIDSRIAQNKTMNEDARLSSGMSALTSVAKLASMFSDEDLKQNIVEVGRLYNGLPVYLYTYKGDNIPQIGLLAQDVAYHNPMAVFVDESGFMKVNYALACR